MLEWLAVIHLRITFAQILEALIVGFIAATGKQGGLEAIPEVRLVFPELPAINLVVLPLYVAQANPPHLARTVHAFRSRSVERASRCFHHVVVYSSDHQASAAPECVFINKELFFRQRSKH